MKMLKLFAGIVAIFLTMPIWFYLLYKILEAVNASELMWFLYWLYLPASIILNLIIKVTEE